MAATMAAKIGKPTPGVWSSNQMPPIIIIIKIPLNTGFRKKAIIFSIVPSEKLSSS